MGASNKYWNGEEHAVLKSENISAAWAKKPRTIDAANRAFCIWFHAKQTLNASITEPHWGEMRKTLHACGMAGFGTGVCDLDDAFQHLVKNKDKWTDTNTENYYGGPGKSYNHSLVTTADSCTNFMDAVDDKLPKLKTVMKEYQKSCAALQQLKLKKDTTTDWEKIKKHIDTVKTNAERAKPLMWIIPATIDARIPMNSANAVTKSNIQKFADVNVPRVDKAIKFLDAVGKIHDSLTIYVEASKALDDKRAGVAFAALSYALTFVPVLGGFYGAILQKIPGLITNWKGFMENYHDRSLNPARYLKAQSKKIPAWRCGTCKSSGNYH